MLPFAIPDMFDSFPNLRSVLGVTPSSLAQYTVAGIGVKLRPCANALRCKACQVQLQQFQTGFSIPPLKERNSAIPPPSEGQRMVSRPKKSPTHF